MHNYDIKAEKNMSLKDLMEQSNMPVPHEWQDEDKMSIFDKAYFGTIPNIMGHKPDERN